MKELPRREFWKRSLGIGAAVITYVVVSKYVPNSQPLQNVNIKVLARGKK